MTRLPQSPLCGQICRKPLQLLRTTRTIFTRRIFRKWQVPMAAIKSIKSNEFSKQSCDRAMLVANVEAPNQASRRSLTVGNFYGVRRSGTNNGSCYRSNSSKLALCYQQERCSHSNTDFRALSGTSRAQRAVGFLKKRMPRSGEGE